MVGLGTGYSNKYDEKSEINMLKRVKRLGHRATKYQFVLSLNQLFVKGTKSW